MFLFLVFFEELVFNIIVNKVTPRQNQTRYFIQILAFPFTPYEPSLIHAYALQHPPISPSTPAHAILIIQDLACIRLIQSCGYAAAIKLDLQIDWSRW